MAVYETGSSTDVLDLLSRLRTFALANGWVENFFGARTTGTGQALQINKGGQFVTFLANTAAGTAADPGPYLGAYAHNTYSAGNGTENQANTSAVTYTNAMTGPFLAYHFISGQEQGAEYLYVIVETTAGIFKHVGTGVIVKIGAITSGQFVYGCRWDYGSQINNVTSNNHSIPFDNGETLVNRAGPGTKVRVDADATAWRWMDALATTSTVALLCGWRNEAGSGQPSVMANLLNNLASSLTGRNVLVPTFMAAARTGGLYNPIGYAPGMRFCRLTFREPNDVLTIGADQWKLFPVIRKNGAAGQPNSGTYGYAFKVN
jgi:hypothetical protein